MVFSQSLATFIKGNLTVLLRVWSKNLFSLENKNSHLFSFLPGQLLLAESTAPICIPNLWVKPPCRLCLFNRAKNFPMTSHQLPSKQGLYDPQFEHDACGVGFVVQMKGLASHDIVQQGLRHRSKVDLGSSIRAASLL